MHWLQERYDLNFRDYQALWEWSVSDTDAFWESLWHFFALQSPTPFQAVCSGDPMPGTRWFEGARLNYAEAVFRNKTNERPVLFFCSERQDPRPMSWQDFEQQTAALQAFLRSRGIGEGDRVAAFIPNIPEASVALMATLSIGAVWSSCSPDFGSESVLDRFRQIAPKVLIATDGYTYNGKAHDRMAVVRAIQAALPEIETVLLIDYLEPGRRLPTDPRTLSWQEALSTPHGPLTFTPLPFSHPLWILFSSGTTGLPKAITHSHGGMLLEHLKYLHLHNDVQAGERFFWYTTTGWMMWNFLQASLLAGATMVLYDGSPVYPNLGVLWRMSVQCGIDHFGTSAPYLMACRKAELRPQKLLNGHKLRSIGSTGAPLPPEGFHYVYEAIQPDVWLCSMSGGTDVCTAWVGSCILRPVYAGQLQCRCLGAALYAFDLQGQPITDAVGEMVLTRPMPCMPLYFWGDHSMEKYRASYFEVFPGNWRHGDFIRITPEDGVVILGRSDATLNRQGVRIGTAEIYRALTGLPAVKDALVVNIERPDGSDFMPLFVVTDPPGQLDDDLKAAIRKTLRQTYSPRHVPDRIIEAPDLPYTLSGKKMETPVKKILAGLPPEQAAQKGAMRNPESLAFFSQQAKALQKNVTP